MAKEPRIAIIGAGELGRALESRFIEKSASVKVWDRDVAKRNALPTGVNSPEEATDRAAYVFFAVPSWAMRSALGTVMPAIPPATAVVSLAKGIEKDTGKTMSELLDELLPRFQPRAVVGGPMLAEELEAGKGGVAVVASKDEILRRKLCDLFAAPDLQAEPSNDPFSVSLAGALKNVYAISLGIADGLGLSSDKKGWLAARALDEMTSVAKRLGADADVVLGTAGAADLIATGYSEYSRNHAVGHEIATKGTCPLESEGASSLPPLMERLGPGAATFPLLSVIRSIAIECKPARDMIEHYV